MQDELRELSTKGLCFKCGEKWGHDHVCRLKHFTLELEKGDKERVPEVVLGMEWLSNLGNVKANFRHLTLKWKQGGKELEVGEGYMIKYPSMEGLVSSPVAENNELNYITQDDFKPVLRELLATHPGLEFLQSTPEFQERYAETVIYRIYYYINRSGNGCLTLRELKRGNIIDSMQHAEEEEDINKVLRYFSYEHFYVIYCKFWELDTDHDFLIDKENLIRYGNHALTYRIVDRIFSQVPRKFTSKVEGKMGYEDFVYFILAEEDKPSEPSLEYWFKCVDLDGNGVLTRNELQFFYEEQLHRMECMAQEPVLFEDILCQIIDMIKPEDESFITLRDLKGGKLSGSVFNILFNLNKFMAFETRDPFLIRQERENPTLTEWDRFAHREYIRLSMEEDVEDVSNGSAEVWDESLEAPF
ncbi:unnamed protein product [Sphenostylis stenocarpa]|uniref:EF-hand domain-containing protein n=1 Tax=Sphenostylis stenocarpa TaxID=92480 RepID=A0AA86W0Z9_9FABA|nr:unnamed protein product [Sphenostylis stenocarpa]